MKVRSTDVRHLSGSHGHAPTPFGRPTRRCSQAPAWASRAAGVGEGPGTLAGYPVPPRPGESLPLLRATTAALLALLLLLPACTRSAPTGDATRLHLRLARGWTLTPDPKPPWIAPARMPQVTLQRTLDLPPGRDTSGTILRLRDVSWTATVTVNGTELPPQTGGLAPIDVPVGPHLRPGTNTLQITITGPAGVSPLLSGQDSRRARLGEPPELLLQPTAHVAAHWTRLDGDTAYATAHISGAPAGSTVHFQAWVDGQVLQSLGQAPVRDGVATTSGTRWSQPTWGIGLPADPALFHLVATLAGPDGQLLDRASVRTGLRDFRVADRQLQLDGSPVRLIGQRVTDHSHLGAIATLTGQAGHNVVEFHGRLPSPRELSQADERGLPAVVLPRCPGILTWRSLSAEARAAEPCVAPDAALARSLAAHPSLVLWILEEGPGGPPQARDGLLTDPLQRPIVGHHLPGQALVVDGPGAGRDPSMFAGHWITEMGSRREHAADPRALPTLLMATLEAGAVGGIVHGPAQGRTPTWASVWKELLAGQDIPPWTDRGHRAESRLTVHGLAPGQVGWLELGPVSATGAVADRDGVLRLAAWHSGPAVLRVGDQRIDVRLSPGRWTERGWAGAPAEVTLR